MALFAVGPDDPGARRDVETWLRVAGGALPVEVLAAKWRAKNNFSATIYEDELVNKFPGHFTGYPILNGIVHLPD
jgi:hypothetical protein